MAGGIAVEIAVQDVSGVRIALAEQADRIEVCSALALGGLTPSVGLVRYAVAAASERGRTDFVHVLVRPRGGGFVYDADELRLAIDDVRFAREAGADGVVIGALDERGRPDVAAVARLVEAAEGLQVTFHRALDVAANPVEAAEQLVGLGIRRLLTSGGAVRSAEGLSTLRALVQRVAGRAEVMAGGGVRVEDIRLLATTGIDAVHLSARDTAVGAPSGPGGGSASYDITDPATVHAAVEVARLIH